MGQCKLSDRQRDLLRLIAQGLKAHQEPVVWWIRITHDHGQPQWQNVADDDLRAQLQSEMLLGDVTMFEACGFITNTQPGRYDLAEQRIFDTVESEFFSDETRSRPRGARQRDDQPRKSKPRRGKRSRRKKQRDGA